MNLSITHIPGRAKSQGEYQSAWPRRARWPYCREAVSGPSQIAAELGQPYQEIAMSIGAENMLLRPPANEAFAGTGRVKTQSGEIPAVWDNAIRAG